MGTAIAKKEFVKLTTETPFLDVVNKNLAEVFKKNQAKLVDEANRAVELGVATDENAGKADGAMRDGFKAIKVIDENRKMYTRIAKDWASDFKAEVDTNLINPLEVPCKKIEALLLERTRKINEAEAKARREAEEAQRAADEAARKREEHNRNISLGKSGAGEVAPVVPEKIITPVSQLGMRDSTRTRSVPDGDVIKKAIDDGVRKIPGIHIFTVWTYTITDSKLVPSDETEIDGTTNRFRKLTRG